ncbi:MAG: imidazole glycerol phosphate synthase subunit HisH [Melioribacteraceae bacterium]|nr:imidazole glycerol phosphate synthase subunit HisH [Melioribacteraceae bacterium]MCF8354297.1 imidazole glycerol phosphate synthase subunit HisH [Melioribacteraceae bacterium]MCF8394571.1 imidazole glycerol phosphate synthase subunit HisH [Melioribacteraceae bacterium]MCF8419760.1 imidazole glycerol phosphate synthase subunit HisH [Melioribacteraceae bacterium]
MIAIIDYGAGNTASVANAIEEIGEKFEITNREGKICKADKIIFPGVGEASSAVRKLHMLNLINLLRILNRPLLGICLGMQIFCNRLIEGNVSGLGIIDIDTEKFKSANVKVPQMGWNRVQVERENPLFSGIESGEYFYFANSFYVPLNKYTIATSEYDVNFSSAVNKNNFFGVQFHPEKSGKNGILLLRNFIERC